MKEVSKSPIRGVRVVWCVAGVVLVTVVCTASVILTTTRLTVTEVLRVAERVAI